MALLMILHLVQSCTLVLKRQHWAPESSGKLQYGGASTLFKMPPDPAPCTGSFPFQMGSMS